MPKIWTLAALALCAACAPAATRAPASTAARTTEFVGHRGASYDAPENTMSSFRLAWSQGVKAIELDIHLTKDGALVVSHDADTKRTTGVDRVIEESTLADLRSLDAGSWKGAQWAGERLPTLAEALATIPEDGRCFIEVKKGAEVIPTLAKVIRESGKRPEQLAIISFQLDAVAEAKRELPQIEALYLASVKRDTTTGAWTPSIDELIGKAKDAKVDGLDLSFNAPLDAESVRKIRAAGLGLVVWTIDDPQVARRMVELGVDGITTNRPAWLRGEVMGR
jgi:glycerophosphoryl diester phosphodiesterase